MGHYLDLTNDLKTIYAEIDKLKYHIFAYVLNTEVHAAEEHQKYIDNRHTIIEANLLERFAEKKQALIDKGLLNDDEVKKINAKYNRAHYLYNRVSEILIIY